MKERPILFSSPMVKAILDGRKTQTRRLMTPQPAHLQHHEWRGELVYEGERRVWCWRRHTFENLINEYIREPERLELSCMSPHGIVGDRLWVREEHYRFGHWERATGKQRRTRTGRQRWRFVADTEEVRFDAPAEYRGGRHHKDSATPAWHKRLGRFMPRALSRITLEITEVRVQRLQEISESDARAEGVNRPEPGNDCWGTGQYRTAFEYLWNQIHGWHPNGWESNPWVWALTFRRMP